jgi:hypothetical protein
MSKNKTEEQLDKEATEELIKHIADKLSKQVEIKVTFDVNKAVKHVLNAIGLGQKFSTPTWIAICAITASLGSLATAFICMF